MIPCFCLGCQGSRRLPRPGRSRSRLQDPFAKPTVRLRGPMGSAQAPNKLSIFHVTASKRGAGRARTELAHVHVSALPKDFATRKCFANIISATGNNQCIKGMSVVDGTDMHFCTTLGCRH